MELTISLLILIVMGLVMVTNFYHARDRLIRGVKKIYLMSKGCRENVGAMITDEDIEKIMEKFKLVKIINIFETGIGGVGAKELDEKPKNFISAALFIIVGETVDGKNLKIVVDANSKNPDKTAFSKDFE